MKLLAIVFCSFFAWQAVAAYEVSYQGEGSWVRGEVEEAEGDVDSQLVMRPLLRQLWGSGTLGMEIELKASFGSSHVKDLSLKMGFEMQGDSCEVRIAGRRLVECSVIDGDDNKVFRISFTKDNRVIDLDMEFKKDGGMLVSGGIERTDKCSDYCYVLWGATLTKEK